MKNLNQFILESFSDNVLKEFMKWVSRLPENNDISDTFRNRFTVMFSERDFTYNTAIAWDKVSGPIERLNLKQDTNEFKAVAKKLNSMKRKSIPELAIGKYKYKETGEYEWFILCSPDRYCVMIDHSSYTNEQVINIELTERNIVEQLDTISTYIGADDTIEVFIYDLSTYDVSTKIEGRKNAKNGVIYMDDESLKQYRDKMVIKREKLVRQMKANKATGEIKALFEKCVNKINEANNIISEYLYNPKKYSFAAISICELMGWIGAYGEKTGSLMRSMKTIITSQSRLLDGGWEYASEDMKKAKEKIEILFETIDEKIKQVKSNMELTK